MPNLKSVQIERFFRVEPAAVWRGWTEPAWLGRWFGSDPAGTVLSAQLEVRPGGRFEISFRDSTGDEHTCRGVYAEVQAETKLSFSWQWRSEPGIESFVTVRLEPQEDGTLMHFEHARLAGGSAHDYAVGWRRTFDKLERALAINLEPGM